MKNIITKALLLGAVLATTVSCGYSAEEENKAILKNVSDMVFQMNKEKVTAANYTLSNAMSLNSGDYTLEWSITVGEEHNDLLSVTKKEKETVIFIKTDSMVKLSAPANYTLTYVISDTYGNSLERSIAKMVPNPKTVTVAELHSKESSDSAYYKVDGVISTVNKKGSSGAFTLTDSTGTIFSYSGANVTLGSRVSLVGTKSDNYDLAQLANVTVLEAGTTNELSTVVNENTIKTVTFDDVVQMTVDYKDSTKKAKLLKDDVTKFYKITGGYLVRTDDGYYGVHGSAGDKECTKGNETWLGIPKADKEINTYFHTNDDLKPIINQVVDLYGVIRGMSDKQVTIQIYTCVPAGTPVTF